MEGTSTVYLVQPLFKTSYRNAFGNLLAKLTVNTDTIARHKTLTCNGERRGTHCGQDPAAGKVVKISRHPRKRAIPPSITMRTFCIKQNEGTLTTSQYNVHCRATGPLSKAS